MTVRELAELVKKMRDAQRSYFRSRDTGTLDLAKGLERMVDDAVAQVIHPSLFE